MYKVCYAVTQIHHTMPNDLVIALNEASVEGLALVDKVLLDHYPNIPPLYEVRPRYMHGKGAEQWKDIGAVMTDMWGDCKDFTAWRLAELWKQGIQARAESIVERKGTRLLFHTYVRYPTGQIEDPAKLLGMP